VLAHDDHPRIRLYGANRSILDSAKTLSKTELERIEFVNDPAQADYILDTYRWNAYEAALPDERLAHAIEVNGIRALGIYEGPETTGVYPVH